MTAEEFDGVEAQASTDKLAALSAAVEEAIGLEEQVATMEDDLKAAKAALNHIKSQRIPDLMTEVGMSSGDFHGWEVKIADFMSGSLPKDPDKHKAALDFLEGHDGAGLIKTKIEMAFAKSQHNEALDLANRLEKEGWAPSTTSNVHPQSLYAWARERIRNGDGIDLDVLGLFTGKVAKMKRKSA